MIDLMITGVNGQLGSALVRAAGKRGLVVAGNDIDTLDIADRAAVGQEIHRLRPRTVVNCAAYTAVDDCETDEAAALRINGDAVGHLADACNSAEARLIHISTDYVFPGTANRPYRESDATGPTSAYGRTKLEGERLARTCRRHLIVRTAWLYGHGGGNFVETIRGQIRKGNRALRVVADQLGSPTFCDDLAVALIDLDSLDASGVVHAVNSGAVSWHGFATEIVRLLDADAEVTAVTTDEFPRPARRPAYSVLDTSRLTSLLGREMPPWQDGLSRYLDGRCAP
jgi:dTDP-4-dehydrorhamnose reductase